MNQQAEQHLAKADDYFAKGDNWYRKAGEEIVAAKKADPTLSNREIGKRFDRSEYWVREIVTWITTSMPESKSPVWTRGSHATKEEIETGAAKLLTDEKAMKKVIAALPEKAKMAVVDEALGQMTTHGKGPRQTPTKPNKGLTESLITFELIGVLGKLRDMAQEDPQAPLVSACMDLMTETLEILKGIREASDPEEVERLFSDLENFLDSQDKQTQ